VPPAAGAAATPAKPTIAPSPAARPTTPTAGPPGRAEAGEERVLQLGKGISIQGSVTEAERIVIEGTMESQLLQCQELAISHSGVFKGEVQVEDADIAGVLTARLTATGSLIIRATGRVLGVARSRRLSVEDGGQLTGAWKCSPKHRPARRMPVAPPVRVVEAQRSLIWRRVRQRPRPTIHSPQRRMAPRGTSPWRRQLGRGGAIASPPPAVKIGSRGGNAWPGTGIA
jgi:cytoskeletal protein CcmA (bactofilin family)